MIERIDSVILKRPDAFFIKMFKPIHFLLSVAVAYLIVIESNVLNFFNEYIHSSSNVVGESIESKFSNPALFIIPIVLIMFSLIIFGIMFRKQKSTVYYFFNIFAFIIILIINVYATNFLGVLETTIVAIKSVKLIHDLVLISIIIESVSFIFLIVRGTGVNFKKFNFDSEISKFDISDNDKEEFELDVNFDLSESRTKRKRNFRNLKYFYLENKFIIKVISFVVLVLTVLGIFAFMWINTKINDEGKYYSLDSLKFKVVESILLNTDSKGKELTDNYLVVSKCSMKSNYLNNKVYLNDFSLRIGEAVFKPTTKYYSSILDLGVGYDEKLSTETYNSYIFVFEIPKKYIESDMDFRYSSSENYIDIKLNPKKMASSNTMVSKSINNYLEFDHSFGDIKFKINSYEINDNFLVKYNYCIEKDDCINSTEYIKPSIDTNFDKAVLKLNIDFSDNSDLNIKSFYNLLSKFGYITYQIEDKWCNQYNSFEEIKSLKTNNKNDIYIGVNKEIMNATSIKIVFNIRDSLYEYKIK